MILLVFFFCGKIKVSENKGNEEEYNGLLVFDFFFLELV